MSYERQSCWQGQTGGTGGDHDKRCTGEVQGQRIFIRTGDLEVRSLRDMRKIISDWKFVVMDTFWSIKKFSRNTMDFLISQNYISISVSIIHVVIMSVNIGSKTQDLLLFNQTQKINLSIKKSVFVQSSAIYQRSPP